MCCACLGSLRLASVPRPGKGTILAPAQDLCRKWTEFGKLLTDRCAALGLAAETMPRGAVIFQEKDMSLNFRRAAIAASVMWSALASSVHADAPWVEIANSEQDFALKQGVNGWTYGYAVGNGEPAPVQLMQFASAEPGCGCASVGPMWHFAEQVCFCSQQFCFQGAVIAHTDSFGDPDVHVPVRMYTFAQSGVYRLRPSFFHAGGCAPNEDIRLEVRFRGQVIWSAETDGGQQAGEFELVANAGERVELWSVQLLGQCGAAHEVRMSVDRADCDGSGDNDLALVLAGSLPDFDGDFVPDTCDVGQYPIQWRVADGGNGHWYQVLSQNLIWPNAKIECERRGGHMATITSAAENAFILNGLALGPFAYQIGAFQPIEACEPGCLWTWVTGEAWNYVNWFPGEPNDANATVGEDWSVLWGTTGQWNDIGPGGGNSTIIEWSADCDNDGTVDLAQARLGLVPDLNMNDVPDTCECLGNIVDDNAVNAGDLGVLLAAWGTDASDYPAADINRDGLVDGIDLGIVISNWGPCGK
jgi:hypothetical protein